LSTFSTVPVAGVFGAGRTSSTTTGEAGSSDPAGSSTGSIAAGASVSTTGAAGSYDILFDTSTYCCVCFSLDIGDRKTDLQPMERMQFFQNTGYFLSMTLFSIEASLIEPSPLVSQLTVGLLSHSISWAMAEHHIRIVCSHKT
jgi:hypothetical protein